MIRAITKKQAGVSIIELVLVMSILALIATAAIPKFLDVRDEATQAAEDYTVITIRTGIELYYLESKLEKRDPLYPEELDSASNGPATISNPFFDVILENPITFYWTKNGINYTGPTGTSYEYEKNDGTFK
ncbi:MAG: type II secretion system protein [Pseudomonadota bacterium]